MKQKFGAIFFVLVINVGMFVSAQAVKSPEKTQKLRVELRQGNYTGVENPVNGVYSWKGIEFARAPRFQAPYPLPDSKTEFNAASHGLNSSGANGGRENCLNLAIYVNPVKTNGPKSVFMWLFGSANTGGSPDSSDWTKFVEANPDIIVVTPNYRGGRFGTINLRQLDGYDRYKDPVTGINPYDVSNNIARLDVLECLKWINQNIAAFGGNPNDVSMGGQSSGSNLCIAVMMMPESRPYWRRALLQESFPIGSSIMPLADAQIISQQVFNALGIKTMEDFLAKSNEEINSAVPIMSAPAGFGYKLLSPVIDNVVIPNNYYQLLLDGQCAGKQILIGNNDGGYDGTYNNLTPDEAVARAVSRNYGDLDAGGRNGSRGPEIVKQYLSHNDMYGRDVFTAAKDLDGDMQMRVAGIVLAEALCLSADVYFYFNTFDTDPYPANAGQTHIRTAHGSENPVIMRTWTPPPTIQESERPDMIKTANMISDIWANFIRTGNPNFAGLETKWRKYNGTTHDTLILSRTSKMVNGVRWKDVELLMPLFKEYPLLEAAKRKVSTLLK